MSWDFPEIHASAACPTGMLPFYPWRDLISDLNSVTDLVLNIVCKHSRSSYFGRGCAEGKFHILTKGK